jgi:molybdopterin converting factor small subunit
MPVTIHIPTPLRPYTGRELSVIVDADTVGAALEALAARYPEVSPHLRDEQGALRSFVNIYVGDDDIRTLQREATRLSNDAELTIVPSVAGGA